eukprot:3932500-Rhodomonas_salina.1
MISASVLSDVLGCLPWLLVFTLECIVSVQSNDVQAKKFKALLLVQNKHAEGCDGLDSHCHALPSWVAVSLTEWWLLAGEVRPRVFVLGYEGAPHIGESRVSVDSWCKKGRTQQFGYDLSRGSWVMRDHAVPSPALGRLGLELEVEAEQSLSRVWQRTEDQ